MRQFSLHFFKKYDRSVDFELLRAYFEANSDFEIQIQDSKNAKFIYTHPRLEYQAIFYQTKSSQVPQLYRIDPAFLDVNIHLEIPILSPDYFAREVFEIAEGLAHKFGFFAYYEAFDNPLEVDVDFLVSVFDMLKKAYYDRKPEILEHYHVLDKAKVSAILRYIDELPQLQNYYRDHDIFVPKYHILKDENKKLILAMEWREYTATVFPPYIDYIFYRLANEVRVLPVDEVFEEIDEFLEPVPGFIKKTLVLNRANVKRAAKIMRKLRYPKNKYSFSKESLTSILD